MNEDDATLVVDGVRVPGRITRPRGAARACILLLPGSLFSDVDGDYPAWNVRPHLYRDLAHQLARGGVVSMRQAKIGPGTGSETIDATQAVAHQHFAERTVVARAALSHMRAAAPALPAFVAGHSEGALVASLLAAEPDISLEGVVSLSGPALRLLDIMRGQAAAMAPPGTIPDLSLFDQAIADIRAARALSADARRDPMLAGLAAMPPQALSYLREVDAVDPLEAVARVRTRVLLVQGGRDQSVTPDQVDQLATARAALPTEIARFPGLQHFYKRAAPELDPMASFALGGESDNAVCDAILRWIG